MDYIDVLSAYSKSVSDYKALRANIRDVMSDSILQIEEVEYLEIKIKILEEELKIAALLRENAKLEYQSNYLKLRRKKLDAGKWDQDLEDWFQQNEMISEDDE